MELVTQFQILDEAVCISIYANAPEKVLIPSLLTQAMGK